MTLLVHSILILSLFNRISAVTAVTNNVQESTAKCTWAIANTYFTTDSPNINLFLINSSLDDQHLSLVYQSPTHLKTLRDFTKFKVNYNDIKRRFAILAAENLEEFISYRNQFANLNLWNARARYVFVMRKHSVQSLNQTVNLLWDNFIINALIVMPSRDNQSVQEIYSWFPYENGLCGSNFKARIVDVCEYGKFRENVDLFPPKVPDVLNNCLVRARVIIWTPFVMPPEDGIVIDNKVLNITQGIEVNILKTAAKHMNINSQLTSSTKRNNWGIVTMDGNTTGNIGAVVLKEIDMCFGSYGAMIERRIFCDFTTNVFYDAIIWCVPRAQLAPRWRNLIDIFKYQTWLALFVTYILVTGIIWSFSNVQPKETTSYVTLHDSLRFLFSIYLAVSCSKTPSKFSGRIVFFMWMFFGINFVAAYQAKLITVLLNPSYETQMNTLEEVIADGIQWAGSPSMKQYFANRDDWQVRVLLRNWQPCFDVDACLYRVAYKRDLAVLSTKGHIKYQMMSYLDNNSQSKIYCFPKEYLMFPTEMYMTKGFPFRDRLNTLIMRIQNAGFVLKWHREYMYKEFIHQMKLFNAKHPHEQDAKLSLEHLQGAFLILLIGLLSAVLGFIAEQIIYKTREKKADSIK